MIQGFLDLLNGYAVVERMREVQLELEIPLERREHAETVEDTLLPAQTGATPDPTQEQFLVALRARDE